MNRRQWLRAAATGFAGLAGCMGNQSENSGSGSENTGTGSESDEIQPPQTDGGGGRSESRNDATDTTRSGGRETTAATAPTGTGASFGLTSSAFENNETIPRRFTCAGANVSPPLAINGVPDTAAALALVADDPDAGAQPFTHWLVWNLPPDTTALPVDVPQNGTLSGLGGARQGTNDAGGIGYTGPCPPEGDGPHTYRFKLYALESRLDLDAGADRAAVSGALERAETGRTLLRGTFERG